MKRRSVTEEELALWRRAMRGTTPLPGRRPDPAEGEGQAGPPVPVPPPAGRGVTGKSATAAPGRISPAPPPEPASGSLPGGLDAAERRRLRRGRAEVEARADLHGMRQAEAHLALTRFIAESQLAGRRCVLVITGKGGRISAEGEAAFMGRNGDGVLRRQVPLWLSQEPNASRVFAVQQAHPRHGGAGALYVFLRKARGREGA